ncbi:putative galactose-1-phosphate uridylyltransferase [Vibrio phage VAP7]|uniref:Putative galactose-1-phosphate uridylyltransferase n=1 Tax=Vibrio phage VAP7 TaxID=2584487 RepID=A0A4Y5TV53_9CAUD|nr:putative galactose-1-phosphate uridylyltransferase [Vibrio phage VAP7]QDB73254.1 putative galactose-1-phosphate uridylyltransferase [Vibrio phage VAP7]
MIVYQIPNTAMYVKEEDLGALHNRDKQKLHKVEVPAFMDPIMDVYIHARNFLGTNIFDKILDQYKGEPECANTAFRIEEHLKHAVRRMIETSGY